MNNSKNIIIAVVVILLVALGAYYLYVKNGNSNTQIDQLSTEQVVEETIPADGTVEAPTDTVTDTEVTE